MGAPSNSLKSTQLPTHANNGLHLQSWPVLVGIRGSEEAAPSLPPVATQDHGQHFPLRDRDTQQSCSSRQWEKYSTDFSKRLGLLSYPGLQAENMKHHDAVLLIPSAGVLQWVHINPRNAIVSAGSDEHLETVKRTVVNRRLFPCPCPDNN